MDEVVESEGEGSTINPLENDLVVQTLAKHIRPRDLLRFRLVCKQWNKAVIPRVRNEFAVRLDEASLGKYSSLSQFLTVLLSSETNPFGSYLFLNLRLANPLLQKLFVIAGPLIRWVRIVTYQFDLLDVYALRELLLVRAPNIRTLLLEGCLSEQVLSIPTLSSIICNQCKEVDDQEINNARPILPNIQEIGVEGRRISRAFLTDLLRSCPNLSILKSQKNWGAERSSLLISAVQDSGNFRNLSSLQLNYVDSSHMRVLGTFSEEGMRLKEFSFRLLDSPLAASQLQRLLNHHSSSLRALTLGEVVGTGSAQSLELNLPTIPNLRRFTRSAVCKPEITFGSICFATQTPQLEELCVSAFEDELNWGEYFSEANLIYPCHSLRKLTLPTNMTDTERMDRFGRMFPAVRTLVAENPRNEVIVQFWTMWSELSDITLTLSHKNVGIDTVLTGIPDDTCDLISLTKQAGFTDQYQVCNYEVDVEPVRVGPSIVNLRGLRRLHIETSPIFWSENLFYCGSNEPNCFLTNVSGYFGLAFLPNLEDVSISCCDLTNDCCRYLAKMFQPNAKIFVSAKNHVPVFEYDELTIRA